MWSQVWHILGLSFVVGCAQAFGGPAYSALVPMLVEKEDLPNAIALNSIQFNLARVIGPVLGGLALTGLGAAWCFGLNGLSFVAVIISLLLLTVKFVPQNTSESILTGVKQGIGFVRKQGAMVGLIALAFLHDRAGDPCRSPSCRSSPRMYFIADRPPSPSCFRVRASVRWPGALIVAGAWQCQQQRAGRASYAVAAGRRHYGFALSKSIVLSGPLLFFPARP